MSQNDAAQALQVAGFRFGTVETSQTVSGADVGKVIDQAPSPGGLAPHGSSIDLVISGGQVLIEVPSVVGSTESSAALALEAARLLSAVTDVYSSTAPSGSVVSQTPVAGQKVPSGTTVGIAVSIGEHTISMPDVTGLTRASAESTLKNQGFGVQVATNYDPAATDTVITQLPTANTDALPGTTVGLVVSKGPAPSPTTTGTVTTTTVPNLVGKTSTDAKSALVSANLTSLTVQWPGSPKGQVVGQLPAAESVVQKNSVVLVFVSSGR
jgi:eukaryotic-like serine/threonine-protein kinase